jgi:protein tyrosine phosphatase (PTP) superfamily phosphohydrolase (DUF442 family)
MPLTTYEDGDIVLCGDMTPEQVQTCLLNGVKSWLYLNAETHETCPKAAVEASGGCSFTCIPLSPSELDANLVDKLAGAIATAARPALIQCTGGVRASMAYLLYLAREKLRLPAASAIEKATAMTPPLKFTSVPGLVAAVYKGLAPRDGIVFRQLFDTSGSSSFTYLIGEPGGNITSPLVSFLLISLLTDA